MSVNAKEDKVLITPDLILTNLAARSRTKVLTALGQLMERHQVVQPGATRGLVSRERLFPAGLPTDSPIALCNFDRVQIRRSTVALATLQRPVTFREMGNPARLLSVEAVFVLAIADPVQHLHAYQRLAALFHQRGALDHLRSTSSPGRMATLLREVLVDQPGHRRAEARPTLEAV